MPHGSPSLCVAGAARGGHVPVGPGAKPPPLHPYKILGVAVGPIHSRSTVASPGRPSKKVRPPNRAVGAITSIASRRAASTPPRWCHSTVAGVGDDNREVKCGALYSRDVADLIATAPVIAADTVRRMPLELRGEPDHFTSAAGACSPSGLMASSCSK